MRPSLRTSLKVAIGLIGSLGMLVVAAAPGSSQTTQATPTTQAPSAGATGYVTVGTNGQCQLETVDLSTGQLTDLPAGASADACVADLAVTADGTVWGILDGTGPVAQPAEFTPQATAFPSLVRFGADGAPTITQITIPGATAAFLAVGGLAVSPDGTLYAQIAANDQGCLSQVTTTTGVVPNAASPNQVCLYTIDPTTATATLVGPSDAFETVFGFLTTCSSGAYTLQQGRGVELSTQDLATGHTTSGPTTPTAPSGMACVPGGATLYAVTGGNPSSLLLGRSTTAAAAPEVGTIDPASGAFTATAPVSDPNANVWALAVVAAPAPPPAVAPVVVTPAFTG